MLFHTGEEPGDRLHEGVIVHDGIPFTAVQPGGGVSVMFRNDQGIRVDRLDPLTEGGPETVVELGTVSQVCRYVQAPAVDAVGRGEPFFSNLINHLAQFRGIFIIQLGQGGIAPPALVHRAAAVAGIIETEIGTVGTVDALEGTGLETGLSQIDPLVVHPLVEGSAVVEHAVQDDAHAAAVKFLAEGGEERVALFQVFHAGDAADILRRVAVMLFPGLHDMIHIVGDDAEMRINMLVILAVVFVAGRGDKDRVQVEDLNPQVLKIIQLVQDALQVAAVEGADVGIRGGRVPVGNMLGMADGVIIFIVHHVVGGVAVAEAVRKDLVLDGTLSPARHMEAGNEAEGIGGIEIRSVMLIGADAALVKGDFCSVRAFDQKAVDDLALIADNAGFIPVEEVVALCLDHHGTDGQGFKEQDYAFRTVLCDPQADPDRVAAIRLGRKAVMRRLIAEDGGKDGLTDCHGRTS